MARECTISTTGGKISIQLSVNNGIISGGDFSLYGLSDGKVLLSFKLHTDTSGVSSYVVDLDREAIIGKVLSWQILSCTPIATDTCIVEVKVMQDNKECIMNKTAAYALKNVPSCSANMALPVKGGLLFVKQ